MNDAFREIMFPQLLDYLQGKSNLLPRLPRWSMKDIEDCWGLKKWDPDAVRPKPR
jgi:hypothetical protein